MTDSDGRHPRPQERRDRTHDVPIEGRCNAHLTSGPGLCAHRAGYGTDHDGYGNCKHHGGATPKGGTYGQRIADEQAAAEIGAEIVERERFGLLAVRDIDHVETVQDELARCAGMIALCERRLAELDPDQLVWGEVSRNEKVNVLGEEITVKYAAELNAWVRLWHLERSFAMRAAETAHRIGMEERQVALAERMGEDLAERLRGFAADMGVDRDPRLAMAFRRALGPRAIGPAS